MTAEQILRAAADAKPQEMAKTASALKILEKLDPDTHRETVEEFGEISGFAAGEVEKTASMRDIGVAAAGGALAALGTAVAMDLYDAAKRGLTKGTNYRRIMEANPDLKKLDKGKVRQAYDSLHRFGGPEFTTDPMVSGAIMMHLAQLPEFSPETAMKLVAARKNMVDTKKGQLPLSGKDLMHESLYRSSDKGGGKGGSGHRPTSPLGQALGHGKP